MFPGQNSRYPDMIDRLRAWGGCERILARASEALGRDVSAQYSGSNPAAMSHNRDVQIGVFLASYILSHRLAEEGVRSDVSLGLSLGEYNHLVEIGALSFDDALRLLDARGRAYHDGPRGLMMSVFPCDAGEVAAAQAATASTGVADVSIELAEKQHVLGGATAAVEAAAAWLEEHAYAQAQVIDPALPMHSTNFRQAADAFRPALDEVAWMSPTQRYLPNVDGRFLPDAGPADFVDRLYRHVFSTVRWAASVLEVIQRFPDSTFVEVGPRRILQHVMRREHRTFKTFCTDDPRSAEPTFPETVRQLRAMRDA